ncbi:hypothetical protein LOTGIDRAFT_163888 [Lottia gigantea]|uniref:Down syndrome cell adhesion molecule-like protein Dscam2 n=1 Tax=Lottia gigantea TaxID=225164 RepID=V3ZHC9_LOTGI|nr:hypothetical protein LOTGIDRAFT_163888 [Lottia gigantea]ESO90668.1 hypothetical protein LOTGIDRAFT_163888 [Lottia gigantea]
MKLSIRCYVSGYPVNTIKWYRDGHMLPMNHLQKVEDGTLIIEKVQRNYDAGRYTCQAKNHEGLGMTQSVYVTVVEPPVVDEFSFGYRKEGDRIMISCVVSSGDLPITIGWYKDNNPIPHDLGVVIQTIGPFSSLLSISDVSPRHNGNYTCYASNAAAYTNYTAPLHVQVPPRWVIKPQNSFVVLHQSVQLDCQTAGTPTPVITWKKAADTMSPDTYETIFFDPEDQNMQLMENGTLFIKNARESEHGHYLCQASNGIGYPISHRVFLTVRVPARFDAPQKNYTVLNNHNITLECQGIGDKPLSITWSFKGSPISTNGNKRAKVVSHDTPRGKLSQLSLQPANRSDSGFYVCNAKNKFGHDDLMIQLVVIEPPEPPKEVRIINTTSRAITLSWKPPYDGNNPIIAYTVQFRNNSGVWQGTLANVTVPAGQHSVTLEELKPSYIYNIRIMANNSVGYSVPSPDQVVTTEEEAPTGPPGNVVAKAIGSQSLQVTWESPADGYVNGKILGYYIGYKETNSPSHFIYITQTVGEDFQAKHTIHNLKKFTEYTVHVKAYNAKGISPASDNIQVFTLEDADVECVLNSVQTCIIERSVDSMIPEGAELTNGGNKSSVIMERSCQVVHQPAVPSQPPQNVQANPVSSVAIRVLYAPPPLYTLHGILLGYKVLYKPVRNDEDESDASFVTTDSMEAMLYKLEKYTNYSIQVLAYTRKGEGVRSEPIYVTTQEDLPESPSDIKSLPVNSSSILVAWQLPEHPNGEITEFTLYVLNNTADSKNLEDKVKLPADTSSYLVSNLQVGHQYGFRITASTMIGEGKPTALILASPQENVPARIASFSTKLIVPWHESITFPCLAVGDPEPSVEWKLRGHTLKQSERVKVLENGSLYFDDVIGTDAANYSCHAKNKHGFDDITYILQVQAPPQPARLYLALTTSSTIQVNWLSGSNGGSPIQGFVLNYKKEHGSWQDIRLGPQNRTYIAANLLCGTLYKFNIRAFNRLGDSLDSDIVTAKTNGSVPIMPPQSMLVKEVNATSVILDLRTWRTSGCPIRFFSVKYQVFGDNIWTFVSNSMRYNTTLFTVQDLHPATWYKMVVTAHSDAGSSESKLTFATLTYTGTLSNNFLIKYSINSSVDLPSVINKQQNPCIINNVMRSGTILPIQVIHKEESEFYEKITIMVPLCAGLVSLSVAIVGSILFCRRRRERLRYKEHASNLRRDITAETSLMNDLDKRLNVDLDSSTSTLPEFSKRNVNLLISLHSDDNINGNSQSWLIDSSKTNSENGSFSRSEDEGNINPYATFNELKAVVNTGKRVEMMQKSSESEDEIALQKAANQREGLMATPCEPYVPFFHSKGATGTVPRKPPPLPKTRPPRRTRHEEVKKEGYDNHGVLLSPRKYASADQIHALFTQAPPRPPSCHKSGSGSSDKGSQRHSLISSVTTVSSSRDELLEALENAKKNPPPPVLFESQNDDSSQPTDSSIATEPGIREFTQSPPKPNEQREASCEVPSYEQQKRRRQHRKEMESDTTECEGGELQDHSPPRRTIRGRRNKQKPQIISKRSLGTTFIPRAHSRTSTTSSEEVTYTFGGRESPRSNSPSEGYLPYPRDGYGYPETDVVTRTRRDNKSRGRGTGRGTPHGKRRYDVSIQTPGTDENKPLVMALAQPALTSPAEEDEHVSLLDRYYDHYRCYDNYYYYYY